MRKAEKRPPKLDERRRFSVYMRARVEVAQEIHNLMLRHKRSGTWLAARLGVKQPRVSQIRSGDENLTLETISDIALAFGKGFHIVWDDDPDRMVFQQQAQRSGGRE